MDLLLRSALPLSVNLNCYATKVATHIKQLGQAQPVPVGQADWDRLCLSKWDRQAACTKPVPLGLGKVKRDLALSHGTLQKKTIFRYNKEGGNSKTQRIFSFVFLRTFELNVLILKIPTSAERMVANQNVVLILFPQVPKLYL